MSKIKTLIEVNHNKIRCINSFVCLTDMAKAKIEGGEKDNIYPNDLIKNWLRNYSTVEYLGYFEMEHGNENFKTVEFDRFKNAAGAHSFMLSVEKWTGNTKAKFIKATRGRYGGTFAHQQIAIHFANWLDARFYVLFVKSYFEMLEKALSNDQEQKHLEWTIGKLTDYVDDMRNLLDTIPHQDKKRNRLNQLKK